MCALLNNVASGALFTYDFPGSPQGSGLAASQTNAQPSNATFGDVLRSTLTARDANNVFNSTNVSTSASIDTSRYVGFSFAPSSGYLLHLTTMTFNNRISAGSPTTEARLFGDISSSPLSSSTITVTTTNTSRTFDFTDVIAGESLTFRYYGWGFDVSTRAFRIDTHATNGSISATSAAIALAADTQLYANSSALSLGGNISGAFGITKLGTNVVTLSGTNSYTGATTIGAGTLRLNGAHTGGGTYTVSSGATLGGTGSTASHVTISSGGTFAPGNGAAGSFSVASTTISSGATLEIEIGGTSGGSFDNLVVSSGGANIAGATLQLVNLSSFFSTFGPTGGAYAGGLQFTIIEKQSSGAITGTFAGLLEGNEFDAAGTRFTITYVGGDGNDVVLTSVPEPTVAVLGLTSGSIVLLRRAPR